MAASFAFRINALHSPTRQILHVFPPSGTTGDLFRSGPLDRGRNGKVAWILRRVSCGVKRKDTIPSGSVAERLKPSICSPRAGGFFRLKTFVLYNLFLFAHNPCFR